MLNFMKLLMLIMKTIVFLVELFTIHTSLQSTKLKKKNNILEAFSVRLLSKVLNLETINVYFVTSTFFFTFTTISI